MSNRAIPKCDCDEGTNLNKPSRVFKATKLAEDGDTCAWCQHYVMWDLKDEFKPLELEEEAYVVHLIKRNSGRYHYE